MVLRRLAALLLAASLFPSCNACEADRLDEEVATIATPVAPLDFGPVAEGTVKDLAIAIHNAGGARLEVSASFASGASSDFTIPVDRLSVDAVGDGMLVVRFQPAGVGEDTATLVLQTNDKDHPRVEVSVHGGPIAPSIAAIPATLTFPNAVNWTETGVVILRNAGLAGLRIRSIGVAPGGNPDFSVMPISDDIVLAPAAEHAVTVTYARSQRTNQGILQVLSNDPVRPTLEVLMQPTPLGLCGDGRDNDGDTAADYPDDPGCTDVNDNDETDPPACLEGATIRCGTDEGACRGGQRTCSNGRFGGCAGAIEPRDETCDGTDDDCDGQTDEILGCTPVPQSSSSAPASSSASTASSMGAPSSASSGPPSSTSLAPPSSSEMGASSSMMMPECVTATDCMAPGGNAAGCYLVECVAGRCQSTLRHDGAAWRVDPVFSPEVRIGDNARPMQALWDGENFLVMMQVNGVGIFGRRVSPAGVIVDTPAFVMDPAIFDMAWSGDRYMAASLNEGSGDEANPPQYQWVGAQPMSRSGAPLGPKQVVLSDNGAVCGGGTANMVSQTIAGSAGYFMVAGALQCGYYVKAAFLDANGGVVNTWAIGADNVNRPNRPMVFPKGDLGFAATFIEARFGGGYNEAFATAFTPTGQPTTGYVAVSPQEGNTMTDRCCVQNGSFQWGNANYLFAVTRGSLTAEPATPQLVVGHLQTPPIPQLDFMGLYPHYTPVELGFDTTNFLLVEDNASVDALLGFRITEAGARLDPAGIALTPVDGIIEATPQLASDGRGRYLFAYRKFSDMGTYVRLFSTCP